MKIELQTKKTRKKKYLNDNDRNEAIRESKRRFIRKKRSIEKIKSNNISLPFEFNSINKKYQTDLVNWLQEYKFSHFVTITHNELVTMKRHLTLVKRLIQRLVQNSFVDNYAIFTENGSGNIHSHIVVNLLPVAKNLKLIIKSFWKSGFSDVKEITSQAGKLKVLQYCVKELKPSNKLTLNQEKCDAWEVSNLIKRDTGLVNNTSPNTLFLQPLRAPSIEADSMACYTNNFDTEAILALLIAFFFLIKLNLQKSYVKALKYIFSGIYNKGYGANFT